VPPSFVREWQFDKFFEELAESYPRLHEIDLGIEWFLSRAVERFPEIEQGYRLWKFDDVIPGIPQVEILYSYDREKNIVYLKRAWIP
jgi:hypothetical protein